MTEGRRRVIDDEKGNESILEHEEEVVAIGEVVVEEVGRCYCI